MPGDRWQKRLQFTGVDTPSRQNIIGLENELVNGHDQHANDFIDELVQVNDSKGRISTEDIVRTLVRQLEEFTTQYKDRMKFYLERLHQTSREKARDRAGLTKKSIRAKIAQTEDEQNADLLRSIDMAFRSVTSLPDQIVERLRDRLRQGLVTGISTEQVLRSILQDEINDLNLEQGNDLREAIRRVWGRTRNDLLRVIRTETVNAYSRVQLQEWSNAGIQRATRHSIDDDITCAVCRALSRPPDNVYNISELLALDYPVTQDPSDGSWLTHPNCRCWFEPVVEDVWAEVEGMEKDLFGDLTSRDTKALTVPIDSQDHVEKMLKEMSEPLTMQFTKKIEELPEWQEWRLHTLADEGVSSDRAMVMVSDESFIGMLTEWTDPKTGVHYIADDARAIDHVTFPMARAEANKKWEGFDLDLTGWVQNRFDEKKRETEMTLEKEGIEIFGGQPFVNIPASNSAHDYFTESYAFYMVNPTVLQALDSTMYDWLNENLFHGREFLERGGIK